MLKNFGVNIVKVEGHSMCPTYVDSDFVLVMRWPNMTFRVGDVVIAYHHSYKRMIKRIKDISEQGEILLSGDNAISLEPEVMGWFSTAQIKGKVVARFSAFNT